ncbi:macrophage mannose receptor 1-like, partial [Puntigrus tetrazona]|uniref:macrophage mannose receptor 1-like n=1 Tax=Puntigrus tetrazona TaxID=1606681 RepID=UPI001C8A31C3
SDPVKIRNYRSAVVCLVLLCVLLLTAVLCVQIFTIIKLFQTKRTNIMKETDQLLTNITNFTEEKDELTKNNANLSNKLKDQLSTLDEWIYYKFSFYYMSNEKKNWTESRRYCTEKGADLIIINNREEHDFVMKITNKTAFWIGLTDIEEEDTWKWVDGSRVTSGFWASGQDVEEPKGGKDENCAVTYLTYNPELTGWNDVKCETAYQWICEKSILPFIQAEMSDDIYYNVIGTESEGMKTDRAEMTAVIYENVDREKVYDFMTETNTQWPLQRTDIKKQHFLPSSGRDPVKITSCLVVLCVLLLTAVIALCVYVHANNTNCTQERDKLLTNITNLTEERDLKRYQLINQLSKDERIYYKFSFYYMSIETKNWKESRHDCLKRGADLIIINNREEQDFVMRITNKREFWIGLTDIDEEGAWKWVDGSTLTSGFWASGEPNRGRAENCVVTYLTKWPRLIGWLDVECNDAFQLICEKNI